MNWLQRFASRRDEAARADAAPAVPGPETLIATVCGYDIPGLKTSARYAAADLYGHNATIELVSMSPVRNRPNADSRGRFEADITMRCLSPLQEARS